MLKGNKVLDYFEGSVLSADVWERKYKSVTDETPVDMHKRLAREFYRIEKKYTDNFKEKDKMKLSNYGYNRPSLTEESIFNLFDKFKYIIPGGSVNAILGTNTLSSLSNCFLGDLPEDNYVSIMNVRTQLTSISKMRGGFGTSLEKLRPRGAKVNNCAITSTGSASFMEGFSAINGEIAQEGRRGALMLSHHIQHPDALEFIEMKQDLTKVPYANVSVKITDRFIKSLKNGDEKFIQTYPHDINLEEVLFHYEIDEILNGEKNKLQTTKIPGVYVKVVNPQEVWNKLMFCAWNTAEPGVMFEDRMWDYSPDGVYELFKMRGTNPCGEVPLPPLDSCRLMSIVLSSYVIDPFTENAHIDEELLYMHVYELARLIDNLVDLEAEHVQRIMDKFWNEYQETKNHTALYEYNLWSRIKEVGLNGRRTGQGITGLGDMLAMLGFKYDSEESIKTIEHVMRIFFKATLDSTIDMAIERGTFLGYNKDLEKKGNSWYNFLKTNFPNEYERMMLYGRRNVNFGSVAPQGTGSLMTKTSSGIEPVFMALSERKVKINGDEAYDVVDEVGDKFKLYPVRHPGLDKFAKIKYPNEDCSSWNMSKWEEVYKESPYYGSCSQDLDWKKRLVIQGIIQKYIGMSISITINLHKDTKVEEISELYLYAWEQGVKGTTIFRDKSRSGVLNAVGETQGKVGSKDTSNKPIKRPKSLNAELHKVTVKGEVFAVVVGLLENKPYEVFAFRPKQEFSSNKIYGNIIKLAKRQYIFKSDILESNLELSSDSMEEKSTTIYTSMLLRHNVPLEEVVKTTKKVNDVVSSFSSALCRVLSKYIPKEEIKGEVCPECGSSLIREDGCIKCSNCSFSKC